MLPEEAEWSKKFAMEGGGGVIKMLPFLTFDNQKHKLREMCRQSEQIKNAKYFIWPLTKQFYFSKTFYVSKLKRSNRLPTHNPNAFLSFILQWNEDLIS